MGATGGHSNHEQGRSCYGSADYQQLDGAIEMKTQKERLLQQSAELFKKAKAARPDKMTEQRLREQGARLVTKAQAK